MGYPSSLSDVERATAIAWFEKGLADTAVAKLLGVSRWPVRSLYRRWRARGPGVLVAATRKQSYTFEFKLDAVQQFIAGETKADLAAELELSSVQLLEKWVREYRRDGEDALRPKPKGRRPRSDSAVPPGEVSELERLRRENERLRAEVAYLGKLRTLREQERR
ncbi:hypothetical protein GCM10020255_003180 [Rhodococcus baikonurensis]